MGTQQGAGGFDFKQVVVRTKNMVAAELLIAWDSYIGDVTVELERMVMDLAKALPVGTDRPVRLELQPIKDSWDVAAIPVREDTPACVDIRWTPDNKTFTIDLSKFLMVRSVDRPRRTTLRVPVVRGPVNGMPDALTFQFSKAYARPMSEGKKRSTTGQK